MSSINPQGCDVASFKIPTPLEEAHDFLWRIHQKAPARGMMTIFNRSHYEDVLVTRVHDLIKKERLGGTLQADQQLRKAARRQRHHHPEVLPAHQQEEAGGAAAGAGEGRGKSLEALPRRLGGAAVSGRSTRRPTRTPWRTPPTNTPPGTSSPPTTSGSATSPSPRPLSPHSAPTKTSGRRL